MPSIHETAYPRLKHSPSPRELVAVYSPTKDEIALADRVVRSATARLGFLVPLNTFQRLGYFVMVRNVPASIVEHIAHDQGFWARGNAVSTVWFELEQVRTYIREQDAADGPGGQF